MKNFKEIDYCIMVEGMYYFGLDGEKICEIFVKGFYIMGEEGYFDWNDIYKMWNMYFLGELIMKVLVIVVFNLEVIVVSDLKVVCNMVSNLFDGFDRSVKLNIM